MTERERLIELMKNVPRNTRVFYDQYADYLLANGVIVPPCKVGDERWIILNGEIRRVKICAISIRALGSIKKMRIRHSLSLSYEDASNFCDNGCGIYFTPEEAEQALRQRKEDEGK